MVENLKDDGEHNFISVKDHVDLFYNGSRKKFELLLRKGVFPYSYLDSHEKFTEGLPAQEHFYDDLNNEPCSDTDYTHVTAMWREFKIKDLGQLCELYVSILWWSPPRSPRSRRGCQHCPPG